MGLFDKMSEPVFLKSDSDAISQLEKLKALEPLLNEEGKQKLRQDTRNVESGIIGEKQIAFELSNSHTPMFILHDVYLESGNLNAQIDYLVFTRKICFVIECKNLYGNIEITNTGEFIRTTEYNGRKVKEGIYSPITQNERHLELIRKIRLEQQKNPLMKYLVKGSFDDFFKSIVVLANPKTILFDRYAPKDIKNKVIKADQVIKYIKETCGSSRVFSSSDTELYDWAHSFVKLHIERDKDYTSRYEQYLLAANAQEETKTAVSSSPYTLENSENTPLYKELKQYRLDKSREEKIKPYFIYNDKELKDIIVKMPGSAVDLKNVNGFGDIKVSKYGADIIKIIDKYK